MGSFSFPNYLSVLIGFAPLRFFAVGNQWEMFSRVTWLGQLHAIAFMKCGYKNFHFWIGGSGYDLYDGIGHFG